MSITYSCKQVAVLLSQAQDEPLGMLDQAKLKFHLSICGNCRNVEQQMTQMKELMHMSFAFDDSLPDKPDKQQSAKPAAPDS